ncbi:MAG: hypothetical protein AB7P99_21585 [Vicinamibacterales bacterium]
MASAQTPAAAELAVNQQAVVETSGDPIQQAGAPKKLWARWGKGESMSGPAYISVYRFTVTPGQRYTLYAWFKPDGVHRNIYVSGDNPLTDHEASFGKDGSYTKGWVILNQQPGRETCNEITKRENFTISTDSTSSQLYLVVTSRTPRQSVRVQLRTPADPDADVNGNTNDPACAARKGNTWGRLWTYPVLLQLDPSEKDAPAAAATSSRRTDDAPSLPLNQKLRLDTPADPVQQAGTPKKLWSRWVKGESAGGPLFVSVHSFVLDPGASYTLYAWFKPDGVYRNLYVTGDNPMTDVDWTFGKSGNYTKGWVVVNQQPGKEACEERTYRENFSVSPDSTSRRFYLIVTSKTPSQAIHVMLKSPPDSDEDVTRNTNDPACPPRKGSTWGRRWPSPVLLQLDPSETGSR